jgi:hypothetical protein
MYFIRMSHSVEINLEILYLRCPDATYRPHTELASALGNLSHKKGLFRFRPPYTIPKGLSTSFSSLVSSIYNKYLW